MSSTIVRRRLCTSGYTKLNPALDHVLNRMRPSSAPLFRIYPSALTDSMRPFGRVGAAGPRILLALDHPDFERNMLSEIHGVYSSQLEPFEETGREVVVYDPKLQWLRKAELVEHLFDDEIKLGTRLFDYLGYSAGYDYFTARRSDVFGGWPAVCLVPTTPLRLLRYDAAFMWAGFVPSVPLRTPSYGDDGLGPDVRFERNAQPVDDETSLGQLGAWAEAGERVEVVLCGQRVPVAFEAAYAQEGQEAAKRSLEGRTSKVLAQEAGTLFSGGLALVGLAVVIAVPIAGLRFYLRSRLDSLEQELRQEERRQRELQTAGWSSLPALSDEDRERKTLQYREIKGKLEREKTLKGRRL